MKKVLKNKLFLLSLFSDLISDFGDVVYYMALMNYVLLINESKLGLSIITFAEAIPVFLSILLGFMADKVVRKVDAILWTLALRFVLYIILTSIIGLSPSLWIVIFASVVNFISDTAGLYENALFFPVKKEIVPDEEREDTMAFSQSVSRTLNIGFKSLGAVLISVLSYQFLSGLNAISFLVSFLILFRIKSKLEAAITKRKLGKEQKPYKTRKDNFFKDLIKEVKQSVRYLRSIPVLRETLLIVPLINMVITVLLPLSLLILIEDRNSIYLRNELVITLITLAITLGGILGSFLTMNGLKAFSISRLFKIEGSFLLCLMIALYFHSFYLILLFVFLVNMVEASLNIKLGALIINGLPADKLGTIMGGVVTYYSTGDVLSKLIFSVLAITFSLQSVILFYGTVSIFLFIYTFYKISRLDQTDIIQ